MNENAELQQMINQAQDMARTYEVGRADGKYAWDEDTVAEFKDVSVEDLICNNYFLGLGDIIRPSVMEDILELWEAKNEREIHLACFEEGIGCGKTFKSSIILWLQWFELSLHVNPQKFFSIESNSRITFVCSSRTEQQAKRIAFSKVYARFLCPFNKDYFPPNPSFRNEIQILRNNTYIYAGNGSALAVQGFDYFGGIMDECNSMERIEDSRKGTAETTVYDAADELENEISNRMTSRFMQRAGMLVAISSHTHKQDFLRRKEREMLRLGDEGKIFFKRRMYCESFYMSDKDIPCKYNENIMDPITSKPKFDPDDGYFYIDIDNYKEMPKEIADVYFMFDEKLDLIIEQIVNKYKFTLKDYENLKRIKEVERDY